MVISKSRFTKVNKIS